MNTGRNTNPANTFFIISTKQRIILRITTVFSPRHSDDAGGGIPYYKRPYSLLPKGQAGTGGFLRSCLPRKLLLRFETRTLILQNHISEKLICEQALPVKQTPKITAGNCAKEENSPTIIDRTPFCLKGRLVLRRSLSRASLGMTLGLAGRATS